ncbi:histone acetyltransferase p300 [Trichonephila clavipes]|uniref:Histone acetyltransferase p300 n=1 Tax=Trichonephila clavipes TaxID=2585209 RepID=A0A8X6VHP4_TRICX|nr:histone acetyltransferase p300 [Trichonephila clavipes]
MRRRVVAKGSTRNGRRDSKCPSARSLRMIREDTRTPSEGATCAWMAADEAFGCTRAFFLRCCCLLDDCCQVIYSQFGLAIHQNDHQARRRFVEWAQNEIAVVPDFHNRILFSDEAHFWLNGYVNKQNCRIWSEANPQVYVETPLHPEELTV